MGARLGQLWPKSKWSCRCFSVSGRMRASFLVLCCAGLDWDTSILLLCWPLWFLGGEFGCCWFTVDLWWLLIGHRALSTFPQLSGATPRLWQCRCPWAVPISSSSVGAPYADFFGAAQRDKVDIVTPNKRRSCWEAKWGSTALLTRCANDKAISMFPTGFVFISNAGQTRKTRHEAWQDVQNAQFAGGLSCQQKFTH